MFTGIRYNYSETFLLSVVICTADVSVEVYPEQTRTVQKCVYIAVASFPVEHAIRYTAQYGCQGDPVAWHVPVGAGVSRSVFPNSTGGWGRKVI